jgi:LPS-assembly protein
MKSSLALFTLCTGLLTPAVALGQEQSDTTSLADKRSDEIEFSADTIDYDFENDIVTAEGNVVLNRDGYKLRANQVVWNRKSGAVVAEGDIRSTSPDGDVAYGDRIELTDSLRDGAVDNLLLVLEDGSRLAARRSERFRKWHWRDGSLLFQHRP